MPLTPSRDEFIDLARRHEKAAVKGARLAIPVGLRLMGDQLAPVLAYTAEEAWTWLGKTTSVHLEELPRVGDLAAPRGAECAAFIAQLLPLREKIAQAIEPARQAKQIGNTLEAEITLELGDPFLLAALRGREREMEEFFIVSSLTLRSGPETRASLHPTDAKKCARCWRHLPDVADEAAHEAQGLGHGLGPGARDEIRRVDARALEAAPQEGALCGIGIAHEGRRVGELGARRRDLARRRRWP